MTPFEEKQERKRKAARQLEGLPAANKVKPDGSAHFRLVGGKHHDLNVRMYAPFDETDLEFPDGEVYEYQTLGNVHAFTRIN
jgi:hypothetical protein